MEVDDIDNLLVIKRGNKKLVNLFLSIAPIKNSAAEVADKEQKNLITPPIYYPSKIISDKYKFKIENKEKFQSFYFNNIKTFDNILSKTFIAISIDKDLLLYKKSIINLVELKRGNFCEDSDMETNNIHEENKIIFITNYSLIKCFIENQIEATVYFIKKKNLISQCLNKLDFICKNLEDKSNRMIYFDNLKSEYQLEKLEINKKFLDLRTELINLTTKENFLHIYKDPINNSNITPRLDMMVLNYEKIEEINNESQPNLQSESIENSTNIINLKFLEESNRKSNKNIQNDIHLISYLNSEETKESFRKTFLLEMHSQLDLFVEKEFSLNFGKIEKFGELVFAKYYFSRSCPGSLIFNNKFVPLGIASNKFNNLSIANQISYDENDLTLKQNFNIFLPFTNLGVIYLLKRFLGLEINFDSFIKKNKKIFNVHVVEKNNSIKLFKLPLTLNSDKFLENDFSDEEKSLQFNKLIKKDFSVKKKYDNYQNEEIMYTKLNNNNVEYHNEEKFSTHAIFNSNKNNNIQNGDKLVQANNINRFHNISKKSKIKNNYRINFVKNCNSIQKDKLNQYLIKCSKNYSFNYEPFNNILKSNEYKEKQKVVEEINEIFQNLIK